MARFVATPLLLAAVITCQLYGCGGSAGTQPQTGTVSGTVALNGTALKSGIVCLTNEASGEPYMGDIDNNGGFKLKFNASAEIPCGKYKVTIGEVYSNLSPQDLMNHLQKTGLSRTSLKNISRF